MDGVEHNLMLHTLRLIGNSCADIGICALRPYLSSEQG